MNSNPKEFETLPEKDKDFLKTLIILQKLWDQMITLIKKFIYNINQKISKRLKNILLILDLQVGLTGKCCKTKY